VAILTAMYTLHSVDRYVIAAVLQPIGEEFHVSDAKLGALSGLAHAIAFSAFALPMGWLLDRANRVKVLSIMLATWSGLTALGAGATGYTYLFAARMGVGAAESASSSGAQAIIAGMFPLKERSGAMGLVFSGLAIGTGLAFAVGGFAAQHWGWRSVFLLAGIPGLIVATIMWFFLKPPPQQGVELQEAHAAPPMWKVVLFALRSRPISFTTIGLTIATMSSASVWAWTAPILVRQHGFSFAEAGLIVGIAAGVVKFASTAGSGFLADWLAKGRLDRLWIVPTTAMVLSAPVAIAMALAPSKWLVIPLVMILGLTMGAHYSSPKTVIVSSAPDNMRGSVAAIEQLTINLIGGGVGPLLTGFISDQIGGKDSAAQALAATLSLNLIAGLLFWLATRRVSESEAVAASIV